MPGSLPSPCDPQRLSKPHATVTLNNAPNRMAWNVPKSAAAILLCLTNRCPAEPKPTLDRSRLLQVTREGWTTGEPLLAFLSSPLFYRYDSGRSRQEKLEWPHLMPRARLAHP